MKVSYYNSFYIRKNSVINNKIPYNQNLSFNGNIREIIPAKFFVYQITDHLNPDELYKAGVQMYSELLATKGFFKGALLSSDHICNFESFGSPEYKRYETLMTEYGSQNQFVRHHAGKLVENILNILPSKEKIVSGKQFWTAAPTEQKIVRNLKDSQDWEQALKTVVYDFYVPDSEKILPGAIKPNKPNKLIGSLGLTGTEKDKLIQKYYDRNKNNFRFG